MIKTTSSIEKKEILGRDWTRGSILQNLLLLSWPMIILGTLYSANMVLEMIWVGKLGAASIAGVGMGGFVVLLVGTARSGLSAGERAMIARSIGGGNISAANHIAGQSFVISVVYGAIILVVGMVLTGPIFNLFGLEAKATAEGVIYLRIVLVGWLTEALWISGFSVMQSSGDTVTPMKVAVIIRVINVILCPILVLGWWVFPRLGVAGAAITYIAVCALGTFLCVWILVSGGTRLRLTRRDFYPDLRTIWRILKIGLPASVMGLGKAFGDLVLTWFMIPFGVVALAAHNSISRIESFINSPGIGLGNGAGVMVGQNLGAGQPKQATRSGWLAIGLVAGFMVLCSVALLIWAENIISLFNNDPDLIKTGSFFLRIAVTGYLGLSIIYVAQYGISGSGDTLPPMLITLAMLWIIQLPLAFLLSRYTSLGVYGVRWAIVASFIVGAIAYLAYFWSGRWKHKKV